MDLLFERDRVYLHKAHGHYGAVPLSVSGERVRGREGQEGQEGEGRQGGGFEL